MKQRTEEELSFVKAYTSNPKGFVVLLLVCAGIAALTHILNDVGVFD